MRLHYTERFRRSYESAPPSVQRAFDRRAAFLVQDLRHPSLRAKKYDEANDIWQARVNDAWRFYFRIEDDAYLLLDIIPHPK
jgi:mRNA interferase RelE/StbE